MSHGRLFRIASEWQKKKKTIWRVWSGMRKTWKMRAAALLLTAVCTVGASFAAYADDVPSGPASDMELIQRREQASGSQNEAGDAQTAAGSENHAGAAEEQQTTENQETGNNGQTASETQGTEQGDSQVPDGMVASGGRYIDPNAPMVALTFDDDVIIGLSQEISYKEAVSMI